MNLRPPATLKVADLNPVLRGWAGHFRHGNAARKFSTIDSYVQERLAIFNSAKHGRPGRGWGAATTAVGSLAWASTASPGRYGRSGRMPDGERGR